MKKIFTILLAIIIAVGMLPISVYAEDDDNDHNGSDDGDDDDHNGSDDDNESDDNMMDDNSTDDDYDDTNNTERVQERDRLREMKRALIDERIEAFKNQRERLKEAKEEWLRLYKTKREQYGEFKEEWSNSRDSWVELKGKVEDFDSLSEEEQQEIMDHAKRFMSKTTQRMNAHVEILQKWVENSDLDESTKEEALANLEDITEKINELQAQIESATTIDELRQIGVEIKEYWVSKEPTVKRVMAQIYGIKTDEVLKRLEVIEENFQTKIDELDASGVDTSEMQSKLDQFSEDVSQAKDKIQLAADTRSQIKDDMTREEIKELYDQAKEYLKEANDHLREAHKVLKELIDLFRRTDIGQETDLAELSIEGL